MIIKNADCDTCATECDWHDGYTCDRYTPQPEGQINHCQKCEELQAQIARLREALTIALGAIGMMQPCADEHCKLEQQDWKDTAEKEAQQALSDTADNDKWLADVKANTLEDARDSLNGLNLTANGIQTKLRLMARDIRNQAKKGV